MELPTGPAWHQSLVIGAVQEKILSKELADRIKEYLTFRHVIAHGYAFNLNPERFQELIDNISKIFENFKKEINKSI
ncbi:MAG: hypothetical protein K9L71_00980 [Candidatus Omnitrophica bacterium]|nr:hypothetical protein [Candidatus Omnitrophota bacterium]